MDRPPSVSGLQGGEEVRRHPFVARGASYQSSEARREDEFRDPASPPRPPQRLGGKIAGRRGHILVGFRGARRCAGPPRKGEG